MQEQEPNLASRSAAHSAVAEVRLPKRLHLPLRRHELNLHMPRVLKRRQLSGLHHPVLPRKRAKIRQPLPTVMTTFASYLLELICEHKMESNITSTDLHLPPPTHILLILPGSAFFFYSAHVGFESVMLLWMTATKTSILSTMPEQKKHEYYNRAVSFMHVFIAICLSYYATFKSCGDLLFTSEPSQCLLKPQRAQMYLIWLSSGFCVYDTLTVIFKMGFNL